MPGFQATEFEYFLRRVPWLENVGNTVVELQTSAVMWPFRRGVLLTHHKKRRTLHSSPSRSLREWCIFIACTYCRYIPEWVYKELKKNRYAFCDSVRQWMLLRVTIIGGYFTSINAILTWRWLLVRWARVVFSDEKGRCRWRFSIAS
jgi:hypothetical protein